MEPTNLILKTKDELIKVIIFIKQNIFPWIRLNRIIRDIPNINLLGGIRMLIYDKRSSQDDVNCPCIRCREVKKNKENIHQARSFVRQYNGFNSTEYFISYESPDQKILYGFLRLRINHTNNDLIYPELEDCSFIRVSCLWKGCQSSGKEKEVQHMGFGKRLLEKAENISFENNIHKIAIISGVGVREYYEKMDII